MPVTYALNMFGLSFATIPALLIWIFLEKKKEMTQALRGVLNVKQHIRASQAQPGSVPSWWYLLTGLISLGLAMFACEYYPVQLRWYGALFAFFVSCVFFVPVGNGHHVPLNRAPALTQTQSSPWSTQPRTSKSTSTSSAASSPATPSRAKSSPTSGSSTSATSAA